MLTLNNLAIQFAGKTAVDIDELSFYHGEKVAIIGRSGCGKSSLVNHIFEQLKPAAALCSQKQGLVEDLSVFHNIFMGALNQHAWYYNLANLLYPLNTPRTRIQSIADTLELDCALSQAVSELSGGQRQRVALGRALYQRQPLFIGDEPFSALDPMMRQRLLTQVLTRHDSVIMVLHDMEMALTYFDRVIGLCDGHKVLDIDAASLSLQSLEFIYQEYSDIDSAGDLVNREVNHFAKATSNATTRRTVNTTEHLESSQLESRPSTFKHEST